MRKLLFTAVFIYSTSLAAVASTESTLPQGDPKKQEKPTSTFSLAEGYFSLFSLFLSEPVKTDTLHQVRFKVERKDGASR